LGFFIHFSQGIFFMGQHFSYISNNKTSLYLSILAIFLALVVLSPVINSGFVGDDAHNSLAGCTMSLKNQNVFQFTYPIYMSWVRNEGRIYPLSWYGYGIFSIFGRHVQLYKASLLLFVLINMLMFGYLIKLMTQSTSMALLALSLPALFFQIRLNNDPILSYCWMQQLVFLYVISSLIFLIFYLRNKKKYLLVLSWFAYALSLLSYEITYPFFLLHFLIIHYFSEERTFIGSVKCALPFFLLSGSCVLMSILVRLHFNVPLSGGGRPYTPNYEAVAYFVALTKQMSAAFPLSYLLFHPHGMFGSIFAYFKDHFSIHTVVIAAGYFILFMKVLILAAKDSSGPQEGLNRKPLLVLGLLLLILPATLISLSPRYQAWSAWGDGHLNVYFSYYGLIMVAIFLFDLVYQRKRMISKVSIVALSLIFSAVAGCIGVANYTTNSVVVEHINRSWLYPRKTIQDAMQKGLFRDVPPDAGLFVDSRFIWDQLAFYRKYSGAKVKYVGVPGSYLQGTGFPDPKLEKGNPGKAITIPAKEAENLYYVSYSGQSRENGYAILGKVRNIVTDNAEVYSATSQKVYIYIEFPYYSMTRYSLAGYWFDKSQPEMSVPFTLHEDVWKQISSGKNWKLYTLSTEKYLIDLKSLYIGGMSEKRDPSIFLRSKKEDYLKNGKNVLLHWRSKWGIFGRGVSSKPLTMNDSFSLEVIVKPSKPQGTYSHIMGNHPGYNYFEGFAVQQDGNNQNVYTFGYGSGKQWLPSVRFELPPEKWSYLAIVVESNMIKVLRNGSLVASADATDSIKNSGMPFWVGNWVNQDRLFNGLIDEIRVLNRPLTESEIESSWRAVKESLIR